MTNTLPPDAMLSNGYGLETSDRAKVVLQDVDRSIAQRAAERANRIRRWGRAGLLAGAVAVGAVGANMISSDSGSTPPSSDGSSATGAQPETTQTTLVKVDIPNAGVYSTGDRLAEMGQIEPENLAEYKEKAAELHGSGPVELNSQIAYPVDHMQPTEPKPESGESAQ